MRLLTLFLFIGVVSIAGCSKSKPVPNPPPEPDQVVQNGRCPPNQIANVLKDVSARESERNEIEKTAKSTPAKENFKKLYDAEIQLSREVNEAISRLADCGVSLPQATLSELKKKVENAEKDVAYLADNFPEFKKAP